MQDGRIIANCEIIEHTEIMPGVMRSVLIEPTIARESRPGQFVNVRVTSAYDPLLRRPLSVHAVDRERGAFTLLYYVVGRGTRLMMDMKVGDKLEAVGPLGSSFDVGDDPAANHVLVAGGYGVAPLFYLSEYLCRIYGCAKVTALVGARTRNALLCERELVAHGIGIKVATDDGSYGSKGLVTDLLKSHLIPASKTRVYACGPMPMLCAVAEICANKGVESCQVSLESLMGCGVGVCMGCVVKGREKHDQACECGHYTRVCAEGPVYDAKELVWE